MKHGEPVKIVYSNKFLAYAIFLRKHDYHSSYIIYTKIIKNTEVLIEAKINGKSILWGNAFIFKIDYKEIKYLL